jgi:hypothetical protein
VWGSNDYDGKKRSERLLKIKNAQPLEMIDAPHACYLHDPAFFHAGLIKFLLLLQ